MGTIPMKARRNVGRRWGEASRTDVVASRRARECVGVGGGVCAGGGTGAGQQAALAFDGGRLAVARGERWPASGQAWQSCDMEV